MVVLGPFSKEFTLFVRTGILACWFIFSNILRIRAKCTFDDFLHIFADMKQKSIDRESCSAKPESDETNVIVVTQLDDQETFMNLTVQL